MRTRQKGGTLVLAGLVMAACQDMPTTVSSVAAFDPVSAARLSATDGQIDRYALQCFLTRRAVGGEDAYEYGVLRVRFPASVRADDGSMRVLRFRVEEEGGAPLASGSCRIPNTPEAAVFITRRLGLDRARPRTHDEESVSRLQGCVDGGVCPLEPLIVVAPPSSGPSGGSTSWWFGGSGWSASQGDSWESSGGGGYSEPGPDGSYRDPCQRDSDGHCISEAANDGEWAEIGRIINKMKANNAACAGAKAALQSLYSQPRYMDRFRTWDGYDISGDEQRFGENRYDSGGVYLELDSYFLYADHSVLVHEGMHMYYNSLPADNAGRIDLTGEQFARTWEDTCW